MIINDESANKNTLNNPAMDSSLQNDLTHEKPAPAFANEAQLLSTENAPIGTPQNQISSVEIGQKSVVSDDKEARKPIGYVEPAIKNAAYTAPEKTVQVTEFDNTQQRIESQNQLNLQVTAQGRQESLNQDSLEIKSKQEVLALLQEQSRTNLAGRFAAMSAHVESSQMTDENKADAQQRLNKATLAYAERVDDKEISPIDIHVAQRVNDKVLERG
ncbi:MAG: hypothetical protein HOP26_01050 [Methylotenera sp.]|nr:hypothetical protein [Methylotenera sp.]